jgi:hypothetical protein
MSIDRNASNVNALLSSLAVTRCLTASRADMAKNHVMARRSCVAMTVNADVRSDNFYTLRGVPTGGRLQTPHHARVVRTIAGGRRRPGDLVGDGIAPAMAERAGQPAGDGTVPAFEQPGKQSGRIAALPVFRSECGTSRDSASLSDGVAMTGFC